tara:strand:+ start:213 stop:449 length:237 start_codon:yes stop_codon:yes gene_type:complete
MSNKVKASIILNYPSKAALKKSIGKTLDYTPLHFYGGNAYRSDGRIFGQGCPASTRRPQPKLWFALVTMRKDKIIKVK